MSWLSKGLKKAENWIANKIPHVSAAEKRASLQATKEQIDYYQQAKKDAAELKKTNEEEKAENRRKINEKEIRSRQRVYKRGGFMSTPEPGIADKLG